ncbi:MAG: SLC13 family permease [Parvibaculum sp.]|nr:SLC13 family permease [Parvibaculum sp.]
MTQDQAVILAILAGTIAMFLWGRWRHDMVALASLLACVLAGLVPSATAFAGFGHPAVITVACVLILSGGLQQSGAVDALTRVALPQSAGALTTIAALTGLAAVLSAFMNNVGALALLMPVAVQVAAKQNLPPGKVLMPLAFGSILGGMTTLIGTPPNLIVSGFRAETGAGSFAMFDFAPVGLAVAAAGVIFVVIFSRWLVPVRERAGTEGFETGAYLTEARVTEKSKAKGMTLREIDKVLEEADAQIIGLVRNEVRIPAPSPFREVTRGDILVIEAEPEGLVSALSALGLKLEEDVRNTGKEDAEEGDEAGDDTESKDADNEPADEDDSTDKRRKAIQSDDVVLMELAVLPDSSFAGRSASDIRLRTRYDINLLAVSRQGRRSMARLRTMTIQPGDVLLMQGRPETLNEFASQFGCVPLAERALRIPEPRQALTASGIMAVAVGGAAFGLVPAAISFAGGVLASMALRVISPRTVYNAVDWPVIVLLGALIPVAGAMATTGTADLIARVMLETLAQGHAVIALTLILIVTMTLSDFMNNAATAAVMCPIAIGTAEQLGTSADPFLMAVAVGASCAFLTPIGHQNNTLILGPGGFSFGDYWRLGLPLELIVIAVGVPMLLLVWPL